MARGKNPLPFDLKALKVPVDLGFRGLIGKAGGTATKVSAIGAAAGVSFDAVSASRDERALQRELIEEYRPEIAQKWGISGDQVTAHHFEETFRQNGMLTQVKEVTKVAPTTRAASGAVSSVVGTLSGMGAAVLTRNAQQGQVAQKNASNIAAGIAGIVGAMAAGRITRKIFGGKNAETGLEQTAHAKIMAIKEKQQQGAETSAADVFQVQLAVNPEVAEAIEDMFGQPFAKLDAETQKSFLQSEMPQVLTVSQEMAERINAGARPQGLIFGEVEPVKAKTNVRPENEAVEQKSDEQGFVERLGLEQDASNEAAVQRAPENAPSR